MLRLFAASIATLLAALAAAAASAQGYPSRPVKIIVPYTAGGSSDFTARSLAEKLGPLPAVPTFIEQGFDYNFGAMIGIMGPAGMPRDIVNRLHAEIAKVMAMPDVREAFAKQAIGPADLRQSGGLRRPVTAGYRGHGQTGSCRRHPAAITRR